MNDTNNSIFKNNLRLLSRKNKQLAATLQTTGISSATRVFPARSGLITAEITIAPNRIKLIHSAVDPLQDAREWAEMQKISADVFVLLGMGLGYPALALLDSGLPGKLLIAEKDTVIFKLATLHCDLTGILENEKVYLFIGDEANDLLPYLQKEKTDSLTYGIYHPATVLHPGFYEKISQNLDNIIFERHKMHDPQTSSMLEEALKEMMI
ncbi:MAG: hypothetical protein AB2L12_00980 [Smithellaceae bacterium]